MARPIPEGEYLIVSAKNMNVALDVQYAGMNNGSNVQVWAILNNRAQLFTVRYNSDDTVRILAAYTGKSVDVNGGNIRNGTNVQQWTNNDTRAQKWVLGATGNTVTFRDIEYPTYKIQIAADTNFVLEIADRDAAAGKNVLLWSDENLTDQHWFFVPRPPLASGGVYELHSMLNTNYVAAIGSSSKSDMAGAIVWPTSGINDQKFVLIEESESENKWRIRNVNSGKYLDIKGNEARNNALVVQWGEPQNVRHQQWKILIRDTHTHTYKGVECPVISLGAYGNTSDGNMYMMHVASASNANSIDILADEGTNAFRWLLYPTEATDPFIPIPANLALSEEKGGSAIGTKAPTGSAYATWTCTQSWTNSGPNHYQWRMRKRYMSSRNSTWQEWSDYTAWETANYLQTGQSAWLADAIDGSYSIDSYKNLQVQFQVRCVGVDETSNLVGETATQDFYFIFQPTFTFDGAGISPAGLTVGYSNDYPYGMSTLYIDKVLVDGENILTETVVADSLDSTGSFTIPAESMTRLVPDGSTVEIVYRAATDQASAGDSKEATVGADEDAGKVLDAEPKLRSGSGRTLVATLPYPNARMWLKTPDGIIELENQGGSLGDAYACGEVVETQDAVGRMTSLHIDGKSMQDGTPSPSSPVPIRSVEGWNLLDIAPYIRASQNGLTATYSDGAVHLYGTTTATWRNITTSIPLACAAGESLTFSIAEPLTHRIYVTLTHDDSTTSTIALLVGETSRTLALSKNVNSVVLTVSNMTNSTAYDETIYPMLELGSTANGYQPYGSISIVSHGKNLLDVTLASQTKNGITITVGDDGGIAISGTATNLTEVTVGALSLYGTATLSGVPANSVGNNARLQLKQGGSAVAINANGVAVTKQNASGAYTVTLVVLSGTTVDMTIYPQVEYGSDATEYEPYTDASTYIDLQGNALRSLPDSTRDALDVAEGNKTLTKRVGAVVFDGSSDENWRVEALGTTGSNFYIAVSDAARGIYGNRIMLTSCQACTSNFAQKDRGFISNGGNLNLTVGGTLGISTIADFRTWLATNPVTVLYPLATPQTIDLGTIDLPYCTDTAYVDAMVQPNICVGWKTDNITAGGDEASCFTVPYPFGSDFTIFTSVEDGDDWGTNSLEVMSTNPLLKDPCHAWSWDGGQFLLEASNDNLVTERTLKPVYETNALNARERESVSFAKTIGGEFSAKGMLIDNVTESTVEQLIALTKAQHVFYRAPSGETADVAIVGVSYTSHPEHSFVQVDMVEETV